MANNAKKYIKLAILAVVSMIIGSVITIAIKDFDVAKVNTNKTEVSYSKTKKGFDSLYETYDTIMSEYYKDVDSDKLIEGAINGMLESLDDEHTMYFDKKSKEAFDSELSWKNKKPSVKRTLYLNGKKTENNPILIVK